MIHDSQSPQRDREREREREREQASKREFWPTLKALFKKPSLK